MKPVIAFAFLESARLLADAADSFVVHCVDGLEADGAKIDALLRALADAGDRADAEDRL